MTTKDTKALPKIVSAAAWRAAHDSLLKKEKGAVSKRSAAPGPSST